MRKILICSILLILGFFLPTETFDLIINKDDNEKIEKFEWVENPPQDIPVIEKVTKKINPSNTNSQDWWKYPDTIYTTKRDGNDLLVLVNKQYKLPSSYAPSDLVKASNSGIRRGENYYLRNVIIPDLTNMINAARADGIDLSIVSGYRSYQTQINTYNNWLNKNNNDVAYVDTFSARAGHSQHQLGTVIDFSTNEIGDKLGDSFSNTKASKWLTQNAYKYGFVLSYPKGYETTTGYKFESWHYRFIGVEHSLRAHSNGQILELYLQGYNP